MAFDFWYFHRSLGVVAFHRNIIWFSQNAHSHKQPFFFFLATVSSKQVCNYFFLSKLRSSTKTADVLGAGYNRKQVEQVPYAVLYSPLKVFLFPPLSSKMLLQSASSWCLPASLFFFMSRNVFSSTAKRKSSLLFKMHKMSSLLSHTKSPKREGSERECILVKKFSPSIHQSIRGPRRASNRPLASGYTSEAVSVELRTMVVRIL